EEAIAEDESQNEMIRWLRPVRSAADLTGLDDKPPYCGNEQEKDEGGNGRLPQLHPRPQSRPNLPRVTQADAAEVANLVVPEAKTAAAGKFPGKQGHNWRQQSSQPPSPLH